MINKLFGAVLGVVIGLALLPVVITSTAAVITDHTGTFGAGAETLVTLIPLLYVLVVIGGAIAYVRFSK